MDIKALIYSKYYNTWLTHKLLHIADSSFLIEDLIDFIGELYHEIEEDNNDCDCCEWKTNLEEELNSFKSNISDKFDKLKDQINLCNNVVDEIVEFIEDRKKD
jgi:hypothetical protein